MQLSPFEEKIVETVQVMQRDRYAKVLPWMVQSRLPAFISERQVRRYMSRLAAEGYLRREGKRMGYVTVQRKPVEFRFEVRPLNLAARGMVH
jgi:hypothetical protein